jgi:hypothetical protein
MPFDLSLIVDLDDQGKIINASSERIMSFIGKVKKMQAWL